MEASAQLKDQGQEPPAPLAEAVIASLPRGERCTYQVYSSRGLLAGQGGAVDFSFRAPEAEVLRFVVFGGSGTGSPEQLAVAKTVGAEAAPPDLVMIVGDVNQIPDMTTAYDPRFFAPYRELLPAIPFYALTGNHDYEVEKGKALLDVFTLPRNGPPGLVPETAYWMERAGALMSSVHRGRDIRSLRSCPAGEGRQKGHCRRSG